MTNVIIAAALLIIAVEVVVIGVFFTWIVLPIVVVSIVGIVAASVRWTP